MTRLLDALVAVRILGHVSFHIRPKRGISLFVLFLSRHGLRHERLTLRKCTVFTRFSAVIHKLYEQVPPLAHFRGEAPLGSRGNI